MFMGSGTKIPFIDISGSSSVVVIGGSGTGIGIGGSVRISVSGSPGTAVAITIIAVLPAIVVSIIAVSIVICGTGTVAVTVIAGIISSIVTAAVSGTASGSHLAAGIPAVAASGVVLVVAIAIPVIAFPVIIRMQVIVQLEDPVSIAIIGHGDQQLIGIVDSFQAVLYGIEVGQFYLIGSDFAGLTDPVAVSVILVIHGGIFLAVIEPGMDHLVGGVVSVLGTLFLLSLIKRHRSAG